MTQFSWIWWYTAWLCYMLYFGPLVQAENINICPCSKSNENNKVSPCQVVCTEFCKGYKDDTVIGIVAGPPKGTYIRFVQDIKNVAQREGDKFTIEVKESPGGLMNICRIGSSENAALGIVQSDTVSIIDKLQIDFLSDITKNLRLIFPLYNAEVHPAIPAQSVAASFLGIDGRLFERFDHLSLSRLNDQWLECEGHPDIMEGVATRPQRMERGAATHPQAHG